MSNTTATATAAAIRFEAIDQVSLHQYDLPELRDNEIQIQTEYSGISQGTEIWALQGRRPELQFPTVPGYQAVGRIEACGADVTGYAPGQRVLFTTSRLPAEASTDTWMGAHVSHAVVPIGAGDQPVILDDAINPRAAALAALPAVSLRGVQMLTINPGDCVVVCGMGLIGQSSAQIASAAGGVIIAVDLDHERLAKAKVCGAARAVAPSELAAAVTAIKPGGADVVIDTTGRSPALTEAVDLLRIEGQILLQAWYPEPISFDFHHVHMKRPHIAISCGVGSIPETLHLMRYHKLDLEPLISHVVPPSEAPAIYRRMAERDSDVLGVVFDWTGAV
ncbi:MAG: zinc-binding alcohol dehydrogenase [Planctomycetota bacterium]|jgi:2-desacetyl-2-hydroxyethyl bacteriochlorophyllide A dehydrogenase|nr:zinc-binding alcohol dehydrogenase [Planctomycetota bacterium]